ncbi:hypothetical protein FQN52_003852, partial [Onygenales sp. PD_12]
MKAQLEASNWAVRDQAKFGRATDIGYKGVALHINTGKGKGLKAGNKKDDKKDNAKDDKKDEKADSPCKDEWKYFYCNETEHIKSKCKFKNHKDQLKEWQAANKDKIKALTKKEVKSAENKNKADENKDFAGPLKGLSTILKDVILKGLAHYV